MNIFKNKTINKNKANINNDYGLYNKLSYYNISKDNLTKKEDNKVTKSNTIKEKGEIGRAHV